MLTWCWGRQATLICLVVLFIASLALAQVIVADHPSAAFYLLPTRASELMVGSFVAFYLVHKQAPAVLPSPTGAQMGSLLGLALIAYAVFAFDAEMSFPSLYTLVPVLGTALVILFAIKGTWVHAVLNSPIFVGIGLISCGASMAVMITLSTFLHVQDGMPARFAPEKRRSLHPLNALLNGKRAIIYSPLMPLAAILWTDRHGLLSGKATQWNWPMG